MPLASIRDYPYRGLHSYIRQVFDTFGPQLLAEEWPFLPESDKKSAIGRGICEWLGWKLPQAASQSEGT